MEFEIAFETIPLHLFGHHYEISMSYLVSTCIVLVVLIAAIVIRVKCVSRFKETPGTFQMALEWLVETVGNFTKGIMHEKGAGIAPWILAIWIFIVLNGLVELIGFRTPLSDLSLTFTMGLSTFVIINIYAFREFGFFGRFKRLGKPITFLAPIKLVTDVAVPVSLSCRLFGNMLGGYIVMELVYQALLSLTEKYYYTVIPVVLAAAIPGTLALYFSLFHVAIQMYIFSMLSLSFINESLE